jgi:hypothetical protein
VKWPEVPACYGWLSLDRRGYWRLKEHVISRAGLIDISRFARNHDRRF